MVLQKAVDYDNQYKEYLRLLRGFLRLTEKEEIIASELLKIYDTDDNILSTENRKKIQEVVGITDLNLNNHISNLKKKGIITKAGDINPNIIPEFINGDIIVAFKLIRK